MDRPRPDADMLAPAPRAARVEFALAGAFLALALVWRLSPHEPNFSPVAAVALFAGFLFSRRWLAVATPLGAMLLSDASLGRYETGVMIAVYASLVAPVLFRPFLRRRPSVLRIGGAALASSLLFFLATNGAVWAFSGWYDRTIDGLVRCYVAGLPFLKFTALGDLFFTTIFFGAHALVTRRAPRPVPASLTR